MQSISLLFILIGVKITYTANFYLMKTMGTGNYRVPAGKTCTIYGKRL